MTFKQTIPVIHDIIVNKNIDIEKVKEIYILYDSGLKFSEAFILALQQAQFGMSISPVVNKFLTVCLKEFDDYRIDHMRAFFKSMFTSLRTWTPSKGVLKLLRKRKILVDVVNYIDYKLYDNKSVTFSITNICKDCLYIWTKTTTDNFPRKFHINYNLMDINLISNNFMNKVLRLVYDYNVKATRAHVDQVEGVVNLIQIIIPPKKAIVQKIFMQYNDDVLRLMNDYMLNNSDMPVDSLKNELSFYLRQYIQN